MPSPEKVLMVHPGKGYRWIPKELKEAKLKWGYEYVRGYVSGDELEGMELDEMTPEQLESRAEAMRRLAQNMKDRAEGKVEKQYKAKKAADEAEAKSQAARASSKGFKK